MRLIQVAEAAKRLGVSRQTLENWGKNGTLKIRTIGKPVNSHWVDADTIEALSDTIQDVERSRKRLQEEQELIRAGYRKESQLRKDIERELFMAGKFRTAILCKDFYMSIPIMLNEIGLLNHREAQIMCDIINGKDVGWIAQDYCLTRSRIMQIFHKGCRKARELSTIKEQLDELHKLRNEAELMKTELNIMYDKLKNKMVRITEQKIQEMDKEECIKYIKTTDEMLKILSTSLVDCNLSTRALNCLKSAHIETIGDLIKFTRANLLKFRNFGKKTLGELDDFLESKGLTFGTDVDKIYSDRIELRLQQIYKEK